MADEVEVGSTTENAVQPAPEGEPQVSGNETTPEVDPKYQGKSATELVDIIRNQEKLLGKQANEVGEVRSLRQEMDYLKEMIRQASVPQERQPEVPVAKTPQFDITDPDGWFDAKLQAVMAKERQSQEQRDRVRTQQEAASRWTRGRASFYNDKNRPLYDGVEPTLDKFMANFVQQGVVKVHELDDPQTWVNAAKVLRVVRGEEEVLVKGKPGMRAMETETPAQRRQADDTIALTAEDRQMAKSLGIGDWSDKEIVEALKAGVEGVRSGLTSPRGMTR